MLFFYQIAYIYFIIINIHMSYFGIISLNILTVLLRGLIF